MSQQETSLRRKWRLSTYALKLDVEEAEDRLHERIRLLEERVRSLEAAVGDPTPKA